MRNTSLKSDQWTQWWPTLKAYPRSLSTERMDEIRATLSSRSSPATERVIIVTFWQRRKLHCEPKSVVKPKITHVRARTSIPLNQSGEVLGGQYWWDGHHELGWAEHRADSLRRWDLIQKFGQWSSLQQRLWFCSWRWQPQALEASNALAPAARKPKTCSKNAISTSQPGRECDFKAAGQPTKSSPNNTFRSLKRPNEEHKRQHSSRIERAT